MKILVVTQYFPPETGAPQNRLYELFLRLQRMGAEITVLTAMPNYPGMAVYPAYRGKWFLRENMEGMKVLRSSIFVKKSKSVFWRLLNYFSFVFSSWFTGTFRTGKFDLVFCESPPLFLGISAYLLSRFKGAKLVFNVSDLWPESAEKLGLVKNRFFLGMAERLERFLYRKSALITGQTQGIVSSISKRHPDKKVWWLPNGVDLEYYRFDRAEPWTLPVGLKQTDHLFVYAGIIGHAQGLEVILKAAYRLREKEDVKFILVGSGPEKEKLEKMKYEMDLRNVMFLGEVSKKEMPGIVKSATAAVIPLRKLELFKGAIPSKIFENLAMKKPILLGVEGEAKDLFIDKGQGGFAFEPENDLDLSLKITELLADPGRIKAMGENGYAFVKEFFNRDKIAKALYETLSGLIPPSHKE